LIKNISLAYAPKYLRIQEDRVKSDFKSIYYSDDSKQERSEFRRGVHACYFSILDICTKNDIELSLLEIDVRVNGENFISLGLQGKLVP
jgi:hypothetical protein